MHPVLIILTVVQAVVMLFELRSLVQSSHVDYYSKLTQAVYKLTNPLVNVPPFKTLRCGQFFAGGIAVALLLSLIFWIVMSFSSALAVPIHIAVIAAVLMTVKCLGYLIILILLIQALCSWLPNTRPISYLMYQISEPIVAPVQKIIPPIGVIDISLMIILIALYALNALIRSLLMSMSPLLGTIWLIL